MRDRFGAKNERSLKLRFHAQTAGCLADLAAADNNIARTALAGAGGGAGRHAVAAHQFARRSLALPSEHAVRIALRTQQ